jgi:hypothetical protein
LIVFFSISRAYVTIADIDEDNGQKVAKEHVG